VGAALVLLALTTPAAAQHWQPPAGTTFAIILSTAPDQVAASAQAVDIDLFEARKSTVTALKAEGKRVICYMSAGSWENWRPDKADFPPEVKGKPLDGWPGERYLDIRRIDLIGPIMKARLDRCKAKGFDAVDRIMSTLMNSAPAPASRSPARTRSVTCASSPARHTRAGSPSA
jgi:hypothetical protein